MEQRKTLNPGFVRVFIPSRGKTTRIRQLHANNPSFLTKHGMVLMSEPTAPVINKPVTTPPPAEKMKPTKAN